MVQSNDCVCATKDVELAVLTDGIPPTGLHCDKDVVFDARERSPPLGRAEWIKFLATFFNEEDRANLVFSREKAAYDATKALATAAAALTRSSQEEVRLDRTQRLHRHVRHSLARKRTAYKVKYCTGRRHDRRVHRSDGSGDRKTYHRAH